MTNDQRNPPQLARTPLKLGPGALAKDLQTFTTATNVQLSLSNRESGTHCRETACEMPLARWRS